MKRRTRFLSGFLAASLCLSLIAPAALAEEEVLEEPTLLVESGMTLAAKKAALDFGESTRVYVDGVGSNAIMDVDYSTTDTDKIKVNNDGVVTWAPEFSPREETTVTVNATVSYYAGSDTVFVENFNESNIVNLKFPQVGTTTSPYTLMAEGKGGGPAAHTGGFGATTDPACNATNRRAILDAPQTGVVTFWYYDAYNDLSRSSTSALGLFLIGGSDSDSVNDPPAVNFFGVGHHVSGGSTVSNHYVYRDNSKVWTTIEGEDSAARFKGWHKFQYKVEDDGTTLYIDDVQVGDKQSAPTDIASIGLGVNNGKANGTDADCVTGYHFIDDVSMVSLDTFSNSAKLQTETLTKTLTLKAAPAPAPVITGQPTNQVTTIGGEVTFTVTARNDADGDLSYQWYSCDKNGAKAVAVDNSNASAKTNSLTLTGLAEGVSYYYCAVTNVGGTVNSDVVKCVANTDGEFETGPAKDLDLAFTNRDGVRKGKDGDRVYLDGIDGLAIESAVYSLIGGNTDKVDFDPDTGKISIKPNQTIEERDKITVKATVEYYTDADDKVQFVDNFVGAQNFKEPAQGTKMYRNSSANARYGLSSVTPTGATDSGNASIYSLPTALTPSADTTYTAWAWLYDPGTSSTGALKWAVGIGAKGATGMNVAVLQDNGNPVTADPATTGNGGGYPGKYVYRHNSGGSKWYYQGNGVDRTEGWHKIIWNVTPEGAETFIQLNGTGEPQLMYKDTGTKVIQDLKIWTNWSHSKSNNYSALIDNFFVDGFTVITTGAATATKEVSIEIPLLDIAYSHAPAKLSVDSTYPSDLSVVVNPYMEEDGPVTLKLDGEPLPGEKWSSGYADGPVNAAFYPAELKGWKLTVVADVLKGIANGSHKLTMVTESGSTYDIPFTSAANTHVARDYYLSNTGNNENLGTSPDEAWATFEKLSTVTFGPGDNIYLDATSFWNGVQFRPKGSGAPGAPITLTKYNDSGDSSKRPILNGNGTVAKRSPDDYNYLAFTAHRKFYPSGALELFNIEHWEVSGLEITNYANTYTQGATGRNGIAIIYDFLEKGPDKMTTLPTGGDKAEEEAFYRAGKLQHVVVEDCYIHDVTGYHPANGASGGGSKMSGGINAYGPYDDLKLDNNIVMYCDVEGIRNDVLAWGGDTRTQFPHYMKNVSISNNFIVGVPGDGVVISSAIEARLANNYLSDAGYSYYAASAAEGNTAAKSMGNRDNPITMGGTNFAGLWFIGTGDTVAEYNESVNNVWTCQDGEAFDADMFCAGTVFQYNYTYRNNGGFCLFMGGSLGMDEGTIVRYNVSVEDGEGIGSGGGKKATFYYNKNPDAIYNNLFILGSNVKSMFGGSSDETNFYNNMVIKPDGNIGSFHLNGNGGDDTTAPDMTGEIKNNLFYPAALLNNVTGSVTKANNITPDSLDGIFYDLDAFLAAQPIQALNGRSALTGTSVTMVSGKGAGVAMSPEGGRSVKVPDGTGFDYTQFADIKTVEGAPTIGKGIPVALTYPSTNSVYPLTTDFFKNDITGVTTPDIGPYQWSADPARYVKLAYEDNGADMSITADVVTLGTAHTLPTPTKSSCTFGGWYDNEALTGTAVNNSYIVNGSSVTLYAKWVSAPGTHTVTFSSQGGSHVNPLTGASGIISAPSAPTRPGYTFGGWYKESTCASAWNFDIDTVTAETTLYAKWTAIIYTVTFDKNGGDTDASPTSATTTYNSSVTLPTEPTKTAYIFNGWNTQANGNGKAFTADTPVTDNITVYAQWRFHSDTYTVTFDKNGGSTDASPTTKTVIPPATSLGSLPTAPKRSGYDFAGWNTKADGSGSVFTAKSKVDGDMTVYAQWKPVGSFTVTYDRNGGDTDASPVFQIVTPPAVNVGSLPAAPTRSGYTFTGWNTAKSGTGTAFTSSTEVTEDLTVYAQWQVYVPTPSPSNPTPTPKPVEKPAENVTATGGGQVTVKENKDGSSTYTFKPEKEKEVLYVRVNGILVKADSYTAPKGEDPSIVVVFGESGIDHAKDYADTAELPEYMTEAVNYVVASGLFQGNGESFVPMGNMNRAMFATVLARLYGADTAKMTSDFTDVAQDSWYSGSVAWISDMGITSGVGGGRFAPESDMTRQELVTLVYRFAQKVGANVSATGDLTAFPDAGSVDVWSTDAMSWAVGLGMLNGKSGSLAPNDTITRVEAAIILQRMADLLTRA